MKQGDTIFRGTFVFVDFLTVKFKFDIVTIESGLSGNKNICSRLPAELFFYFKSTQKSERHIKHSIIK